MITLKKSFLSCLLFVIAARLQAAEEEGEVSFQTRTYQASQALNDKVYRSPSYLPTRGRAVVKPLEPGQRRSFWQRFQSRKPQVAGVPLDGSRAIDTRPLEQRTRIRIPTIQAPARAVTEKQPFTPADKKLQNAAFKVKQARGDKNPLLAPRQGIKELK